MPPVLLLSRADIRELLPLGDCIDAVEAAFVADAARRTIPAGVLGSHVVDGGFHVKTAGLLEGKARYAVKINANFPANRRDSSCRLFRVRWCCSTRRTERRSRSRIPGDHASAG